MQDDRTESNGTWTATAVRVVALCFVLNMIDGLDVLLLSYLAPAIGAAWQLPATALGIVFSAGLAGMALGGLLVAPLADRFGRRRLILVALTLMTLGMAGCALSRGVLDLVIARVVVGTGIGTALACMAALVAEFAPPRGRHFAVGVIQAGYPIGATITGFVTAWALGVAHWSQLFLAGAALSALLLPLLALGLPESTALRNEAAVTASPGQVLGDLLAPVRRANTLRLWLAAFAAFMTLYFIVSWIPRLAIEAGLDARHGIYAGAIYNIGAFAGTTGLAWFAGRFPLKRLITGFLLASAVLLIAFGALRLPVPAELLLAFAIGVTLQGGFNGLYPLAASLYPAERRSAGLGWAMGIGRAGAVIGPLLGGYILAREVPLVLLFAVFALPVVVSAICVRGVR
ncbi:MAG: hypothetical protein RLZZ200_2977 [Pseudomonadota bacterium]|jgi:MFS family permease